MYRGWVPKEGQAPSGVLTWNLPILNMSQPNRHGIYQIKIIAPFSYDMLLTHYWELLLECPDVLNQTHIDGLNQIDATLDLLPLAKNQLNTFAYS